MLLPVQIWQPTLEGNLFDPVYLRDLMRAREVWTNEDAVVLLPDASETVRYRFELGSILRQEVVVHSEKLNVITIFHVDEKRRVYPEIVSARGALRTLPTSLYRLWLNTAPVLVEAPLDIKLMLPRFEGERIFYRQVKVPVKPGPIIPLSNIQRETRTIEAEWPPRGTTLPTPISPESESLEHYGQLRYVHLVNKEKRRGHVTSANDRSMRAALMWVRWKPPFDAMIPKGAGLDALNEHRLMRQCVQDLTAGRLERARQVIESYSSRACGSGHAWRQKIWLMPRLFDRDEDILAEAEGHFNIPASTSHELLSSPTFREIMRQEVRLDRIDGWIGFMWWELLQDMDAYINVRYCNACGQVIRGGRRDRMYCTVEENPVCVRMRGSQRQRGARIPRRLRKSRSD